MNSAALLETIYSTFSGHHGVQQLNVHKPHQAPMHCYLFLNRILDLIREINDPEHPLSLEELNVVELTKVEVDDDANKVEIHFTPTIPHCSMATLIGLSIRVKLLRSLPSRFKVDVRITPGAHASEHAGE